VLYSAHIGFAMRRGKAVENTPQEHDSATLKRAQRAERNEYAQRGLPGGGETDI